MLGFHYLCSMAIDALLKFLPEHTSAFLKKWFGEYGIHIKVTRDRKSKLGDYRKLPNGGHQITLNGTMPPDLFFFVLTHEMAHLLAFEKYGRKIAPHGAEWKATFREMILESLAIYPEALQKILLSFSKSPKANFMASPDLVRYFHIENEEEILLEKLKEGHLFIYRGKRYQIQKTEKKKYICIHLASKRVYFFKPLAKVEKYVIDDGQQ